MYNSSKRFGQQKFDEKKNKYYNNLSTENLEEKEIVAGEDKLSNVSTANSDKKNQIHEEESQQNHKKIDYEFRIIEENNESSLTIENVYITKNIFLLN